MNQYIEEMRGRLGLKENDDSQDEIILAKDPMDRVALIAGWVLGDDDWAWEFKDWCESQGLKIVEEQ